jgi:hypothetical protein
MHEIAMNGRALAVSSDGQDWRVAWHPPPDPPPGTPHGAAAVCGPIYRRMFAEATSSPADCTGSSSTAVQARPYW